MDNFISFHPCDAQLPGMVRFVITAKAYQQVIDHYGRSAMEFLTRFSASRVLIGVRCKEPDRVRINTPGGVFSCVRNDSGFLVTTFKKSSMTEQNIAMKYGVCFQVTQGVIVQLRLQQPYDLYVDLVCGQQDYNKLYEQRPSQPAVRLMLQKVAEADDRALQEQPQQAQEEYRPQRRLAMLLDTAEQYANLSSEIERQAAIDLGNQVYNAVSPAQYDRVDRVAYKFGVRDLDEKIFKVGVRVDITDKEGQIQPAEIIAVEKEDPDAPATALVLLFNGQIPITAFHSTGMFSLSFSTVNRDVQLAAVEKLRGGTAKARYMDQVFGQNQPGGFENKDLTGLMDRLNAKKYPPNDSQKNAIAAGINTKDVFLVMGPPGTGKTTVILEWVKYFVTQEHKRVLVTSQNNKAVDNVLARIADEPDVDVIRIGSESKLQSDVTPYMFENKIETLRKSIDEGTQTHQDTIRGIVSLWRNYETFVAKTVEASAVSAQRYRFFGDQVQQKLTPVLRMLYTLRLERNALAVQMQKTVRTMERLAQKLRYHEQCTNFLIRIFTGLLYPLRLKKLRKLPQKLADQRMEEAALQRSYAGNYARFLAQRDQVKQEAFTPWFEAEQTARDYMEEVKRRPQRSEADIWDLFGATRQLPIESREQLPALQAQLQQDMGRATTLWNVLDKWRNDMGGKQNYALGEIILESVDLVGATCIGVNSQRKFADLDFDVTIMDEAGQIQIHNALVPMSVSNKLIMLGDHKQIPPSADGKLVEACQSDTAPVDTELLYKSLFEAMYEQLPKSNKLMLDTQYRMPGQIADVISEWFYDGEYYSPPFKRDLPGMIPALSKEPFVVVDTGDRPDRFERPIKGEGADNALEADIIAAIVAHLAQDPEFDLKELGVISAYKSQVKLIKQKLAKFLPPDVIREMVASLDSYQGQERDVILYSFTKSSNIAPQKSRIGFLAELRRLNVAMTRCKKSLVLIGDMPFLGGCRFCVCDEFGNELPERNEKQFGAFIRKMLEDVETKGRGERISSAECLRRLKGGEG